MRFVGDRVVYVDATGVERAALVIDIKVDAAGRRQIDHALDLVVFSPAQVQGLCVLPLYFGAVPWGEGAPHTYRYEATWHPPMPIEPVRKDLAYYQGLDYPIEAVPGDDDGVVLRVPLLPTCWAQGKTEKAARANLADCLRVYFETCLAAGLPIPEPDAPVAA